MTDKWKDRVIRGGVIVVGTMGITAPWPGSPASWPGTPG